MLMIPDDTPSIRSISYKLNHITRFRSFIDKVSDEIELIFILQSNPCTKCHKFIIATMHITDK